MGRRQRNGMFGSALDEERMKEWDVR